MFHCAVIFTSIDDSATVVEDYSALVQCGNCVKQMERPQIPLKLQLRTIASSGINQRHYTFIKTVHRLGTYIFTAINKIFGTFWSYQQNKTSKFP